MRHWSSDRVSSTTSIVEGCSCSCQARGGQARSIFGMHDTSNVPVSSSICEPSARAAFQPPKTAHPARQQPEKSV